MPPAGDPDALPNLAAACWPCNRAKSDATTGIDPRSGAVTALFNPRTQQWDEHFIWSSDFLDVIGVTPTGRATVVALRPNRPEYRRQRARLRAAAQGGGPVWP